MQYYSLNQSAPKVSFSEAVIKGIAPDKGLYFPERIMAVSKEITEHITELSNETIAYETIKQFVDNDIPEKDLKAIIKDAIAFDFPVVQLHDAIYTLELFHGPTMAFKDLGARFMAKCLEYFNQNSKEDVTVLVATSGDTGGAVAHGFYKTKGVNVVILYPSGKVSAIQEKQLTTLGHNITALEVNGSFDDCQAMVKRAFLDMTIKRKLTSANSINVARWLPQLLYYFFAYKKLKTQNKNIVFSVPSGNFGNICAGIVASKLGLPVKHFVAATNINNTVPLYLQNGNYQPKTSKPTISNAMDVGNPSNFIRIQKLFNHNFETIKQHLSSYSFSDNATKSVMKKVYTETAYVLDPHGATGYLGLRQYGLSDNDLGVFLETAHPIKFLDVVETTLGIKLEIPKQIISVIHKEKKATKIADYKALKAFLNA